MEAITIEESKRLIALEKTIEKNEGAMLETAQALRAIKSEKLYRADYGTFEAYCNQRWDFSRQHGYRLIAFATEAEMSPTGDTKPENERQARAAISARKPIADKVLTPAPMVDVEPTKPTLDNEWNDATGMDAPPAPRRELTKEQIELLEQLDVVVEDIKAVRDCMADGTCDADAIGAVALNFQVTYKMLNRYQKTIKANQ